MTEGIELTLSERQLRTVRLFAKGLSNREIAELDGISPRTVKSHLTIARLKLGVKHSREIPYALLQRGINAYPEK